MPRKRYYREEYRPKRRSRNEEYDSSSSYYPRKRRGCLSGVLRFFRGLAIVLATIVGIVLFGLVATMVVLNFATFIRVLYYAFYVVLGLLALGVIYFIVRVIVSISRRLSAASVARSQAKLEREKVAQSRVAVEAQRIKLAQEATVFAQRHENGYYQSPRRTRILQDIHNEEEYRGESSVNGEQASPISEIKIPGMPEKGQIFRYGEIQHHLRPGQVVALIRKDNTIRLEPWDMFKTVLLLGTSSSGKTSTMIEKTLAFVGDGVGRIIPCDPHAAKEESLFNRIYPLEHVLYPGACFAVGHQAILENLRLGKHELEKRVAGADCSVPILIIVEELNRLLEDEQIAKEIAQIFRSLGREGRGFNVYLLAGCQEVTGIAKIRKLFISYIVHRCDESEARLIIPYRYARYASELAPGQCFVKDIDGRTEAGMQVLVSLEDIQRVVKRLSGQRQNYGAPRRRQVQPPPSVQPPRSPVHSHVPQPIEEYQQEPARLRQFRGRPQHPATEGFRVSPHLPPSFNEKSHTKQLLKQGEAVQPDENMLSIPDTFLAPDPGRVTRQTEELEPRLPLSSADKKFAQLAQMRRRKIQKID